MKLSDSLKAKKKKNPEEQVKYHLHKSMAGFHPARTHKRLHASDMTKEGSEEFCPREYALLDITKSERKDEFISTSLACTFQAGINMQDSVIDWLADIDMAITDWKCLNCSSVIEFSKRPMKCHTCNSKRFEPQEHRFVCEESGVSCGIDTLWNNGKMLKNQIIEIKTIKNDDFKSLVAPLVEHKIRTNLYMYLVENSVSPYKDRVNIDEAIVLYVTKGAFGAKDTCAKDWGIADAPFSPFKEFVIKRDDSLIPPTIEYARRLTEYRNGKKGIPLGICPTSFTKRAKCCSMIKECFSGKFVGTP